VVAVVVIVIVVVVVVAAVVCVKRRRAKTSKDNSGVPNKIYDKSGPWEPPIKADYASYGDDNAAYDDVQVRVVDPDPYDELPDDHINDPTDGIYIQPIA
jgi:hypothetical protein